MGKGRATVVLKRAEHRSDVDLVARTGQNAAAIVVAHVVAQRGNRDEVLKVEDRAGLQNRVPDDKAPAGPVVVDAAAVGVRSRVAADGAVVDCQQWAPVIDAAAPKIDLAHYHAPSVGDGEVGN